MSDNRKRNQSFGKAGATFKDKDVQKKFGAKAVGAGYRGEQILHNLLRNNQNGWLPEDVPLFSSLKVPGRNSDIDFAACIGNKVLLIDAKMYGQSGGVYWTRGNDNLLHKDFNLYETSSGGNVKLSGSMIMAKKILEKKLPNHKIEAIVVLVKDPKNHNAKMPNTWFMKYPGKIQAYNQRGAWFYIKKFFLFGKVTQETRQAEAYLKKLLQ